MNRSEELSKERTFEDILRNVFTRYYWLYKDHYLPLRKFLEGTILEFNPKLLIAYRCRYNGDKSDLEIKGKKIPYISINLEILYKGKVSIFKDKKQKNCVYVLETPLYGDNVVILSKSFLKIARAYSEKLYNKEIEKESLNEEEIRRMILEVYYHETFHFLFDKLVKEEYESFPTLTDVLSELVAYSSNVWIDEVNATKEGLLAYIENEIEKILESRNSDNYFKELGYFISAYYGVLYNLKLRKEKGFYLNNNGEPDFNKLMVYFNNALKLYRRVFEELMKREELFKEEQIRNSDLKVVLNSLRVYRDSVEKVLKFIF